jgi:acetylornithine deacetylase/succinyl-diaminopimelate desuccinylase-like protein
MRHIDEAHFPNVVEALREGGLDPATELVPVAPAAHYGMGGIVTDLDGATTVPGLYAVGEAACTGLHGANRLASNSLSECFVFAARAALAALDERSPGLAPLVEPMFRVTLAPTMVDASRQMNVVPDAARVHVDCRTPPGMDEPEVTARIREVIGDDGYRLEFTERAIGNASPPGSPLMDALRGWLARTDPGARFLPKVSAGFSDSQTFRAAFPDCVAYGFFPHRHMSFHEVSALPHARDERVDVRDLALATDCYRSVTLELLGS